MLISLKLSFESEDIFAIAIKVAISMIVPEMEHAMKLGRTIFYYRRLKIKN